MILRHLDFIAFYTGKEIAIHNSEITVGFIPKEQAEEEITKFEHFTGFDEDINFLLENFIVLKLHEGEKYITLHYPNYLKTLSGKGVKNNA